MNLWVVWNIGQGQWVTHIQTDECRHFDAGGEAGSFRRLKKAVLFHCGNKRNLLFLSHWDYDHFVNVPELARALPFLCWAYLPAFGHQKAAAKKITDLEIPECKGFAPTPMWAPVEARNTNESSAVLLEQGFLLPGDSPITKEKSWAVEMDLSTARILVLGHHGSRSSTGRELLERLPNLHLAISSARQVKYGHPHRDTLNRLSEFHIPVLRTEDWGNIWFLPSGI